MLEQLVPDQWIKDALAEDIGEGDKTTLSTIDPEIQGQGRFLADKTSRFAVSTLLSACLCC
ncbi:MAG: hypothetical protein R3A45_02735 [Bdellovibrionota bacterium]